jgi:alpha-D-ribose 1-methylphosphonate 5-triphosphate diphosphatase
MEAIERQRPQFAADTRFHLRHETYNLDAEAEISDWLMDKRIGLLAFNDHMTSIVRAKDRAHKIASMIPRSGLSTAEFEELVERTVRRGNEVPDSVSRLAEIAVANGIPILSHDDSSPEQRRWYRSLGCKLSEFPVTIETAEEAARENDDIIFGAPNVVRGGSHTGWTKASDMIARGLCSVLASDYYYPAPFLAAFRLAADGTLPFEKAWALVSARPARRSHSGGYRR